MKNIIEAIMNALKSMDDEELVYVWNEYCQATNSSDDEIFPMGMFSEIYANDDAEEVATRCFYGHDEWDNNSSFNPNRPYFVFNGYGNPVSVGWVGYNEYADKFGEYIDEDALAEYIADNGESFGNYDLEEALEEA